MQKPKRIMKGESQFDYHVKAKQTIYHWIIFKSIALYPLTVIVLVVIPICETDQSEI